MMYSKSIHGTDVREMGRQFTGRCVSRFLKTTDTFAVRPSNGRVPVCSDLWKLSRSAGDRVSAQFFKTALGIWSGPQALNGLIDLCNLHTPAVSTVMSQMLWRCRGPRCDGADPSSLVMTLWNCSKRISSFSLLSPTSDPFFLLQCCLVSYF